MPMERVDRPGESQEATEGKKMLGDLRVVCGFGVGSIPSTPPSKVPFKGLEGVLEGRGGVGSPLQAPCKPLPPFTPFKLPSCHLQGPLQAPFSPLQAPFKPLRAPFKPPSSFLHLEAPLEAPWQTKGL